MSQQNDKICTKAAVLGRETNLAAWGMQIIHGSHVISKCQAFTIATVVTS